MPMSEKFKERLFAQIPEISAYFGTPFHIYDETGIKKTSQQLIKAFAGIESMLGLDQSPNFEGAAWHLLRHDEDTRKDIPAAARQKLLPTPAISSEHAGSLRNWPTDLP